MRLSHEVMLALTYVSGISQAESLRDRFIESINELDIPCRFRFSPQVPGDLPEEQIFPIKTLRSVYGFALAEGKLGPDEIAIIRNGFQFLAVLLENREQAAKLLQESEDRFEHMFNNSVIGKSITYPSGEMEPNQAFADMLGYAVDELKRMRWQDVTHPDDVEESRAVVDSILKGERSRARFTKRYLRKDGLVVWTDVMTSIQRGSRGEPLYLMTAISDISERVRVETTLKQSEEKWRNILTNTPQIGVSLDPQGRIIFANRHFLELTGWREEEVLGQNWFELCVPEDRREAIRDVFRRVMDDRNTSGFTNYENEILTKTGESRTIAWSNSLTKDIHDQIAEVTCLGIDLTERLRTEEELRQSEAKYRLLVENQNDLVVKVDLEGRFLFVSPSYCRTFGKTEDELLGKHFLPLVHEEDREETAQAMQALYSPPYIASLTQRAMTQDGWRWFSWVDTAVMNTEGRIVEIVGVGRDITEQKQAEQEQAQLREQLQRVQRMEAIGNLAGGIAHDFNNILASMIGFTELALDEVAKGSDLESDLLEIHAGGKRARELVKQILAFARPVDEAQKPVQVDAIARELITFIRASIPSSIEIKQSIESEAEIMGSPARVHQILLNLLTNAAQAMGNEGGQLELGIREVLIKNDRSDLPSGEYIEIRVTDTGTGIAPEHLDAIFDPYFTTKAPGEGTGLGLSLVHNLVQGCGGSIEVASELGKGSTFTLLLPIIRAQHPEPQGKTQGPTSGTERILFVDDEEAITRMGVRILSRLGYSVTPMTSSQEALERFRQGPLDFDLVISDVTMPGMSGDALARELRDLRPELPVILCSGYSKTVTATTAADMSINAFIDKPILKEDLSETVRRILDEAQSKHDPDRE